MDWTILLGQFGGFWVVVALVFRVFYVPKAYMVPRWIKDKADTDEEKFKIHLQKLWEAAVNDGENGGDGMPPQDTYATPGDAVPPSSYGGFSSYPPSSIEMQGR